MLKLFSKVFYMLKYLYKLGNLTLSLKFWHLLMYMASKCYYMDLLGMSGNINIQSRNNGNTKSDIRAEVMLPDWPQHSSGT